MIRRTATADRRPAASPRPAARLAPGLRDPLLAAAAAALAALAYARCVGGFFSPDDLVCLERARGLAPPQPLLFWRFLTGHVYFALGSRILGADPRHWFTVNVALHAVNTALLYAFVRRWGGGSLAAFTAAVLFGVSRLWLSTVQQAVTVGELTSLPLAMAALLLAGRERPARLAAIVLAAALLCKENVLALPLLLLWPGVRAEPWRARWSRTAPLLVPGALLLLYLGFAGAGSRTFGGPAYAAGIGPHVFHNLMTYLLWSVDLRAPILDLETVWSPSAWQAGLPLALGIAALALASRRSRRVVAAGAVWWLLALVPVLPLLRHSYLFYLYAPCAGLAMAVGGAWEWAWQSLARLGASRAAGRTGMSGGRGADQRAPARIASPAQRWRAAIPWLVTIPALAFYGLRSAALTQERYSLRLEGIDLPHDPFLLKSEIARRVAIPFGEAVAGRRVRAVFVLPQEGTRTYSSRRGAPATPDSASAHYDLVPTVLDGGRALRALYPNVDSVAFVRPWTAAYRDFELFVTTPEGRLVNLGAGPVAHAQFGLMLLNARFDATARTHLEQAIAAWPGDPRLRFEHAIALGHLGDVPGERRELAELLPRVPGGPLADQVRARLTALGPADSGR